MCMGFRGGKYDWVSTRSFDKATHWRLAALRDRLQYVILSVQLISIRKFFGRLFVRLWWSVVGGKAAIESSVVSLLLKRPSSLAFLLRTVSVGLQLMVISRLHFKYVCETIKSEPNYMSLRHLICWPNISSWSEMPGRIKSSRFFALICWEESC